ncbi:hypothetical protein [Streptomyces sp. NPDC060194]|uniref:hypothetical protein n=1 Tax=Streptomyces sp. NPDC060194 TaxID=3347069 RepID=UPI003650B94B
MRPPTRPGGEPVAFVLRRMPHPLLDAMAGRVPAAVHATIRAELAHRTPQQLSDRVERRWYGRWAHALRARDEEGRLVRGPDEIAVQLVAPGPCPAPACEDGVVLGTDRTCPRCARPEHRADPAPPPRPDDRARREALTAMRAAVMESPHRTSNGATRRARGLGGRDAQGRGQPPAGA